MARPASDTSAEVIYLDTPDAVDRFVATIASTRAIALDTEGASFHRFIDRIYLLQLSTHERSAIIDPIPTGPLAALGKIVEDPAVQVVFHDADYDLRLLHQDYGWRVTNIFDTRIAAQLLGLKAFGLAALLERYFGVKLDKKHQRADWSMRPLTADMLDYAAQDTRYLLELRDRMRAELEKAGRWSWAEEEFARLEGTQWAVEEPDQGFLKLKGARDLSRRELALLRELVRWRDGIARDLDRATFRVAGNEVLLEIARTAPTTRDELVAIKGMPRGSLDSRAADILAAVRAGQAVADADLPRFPKSARWDRDPDFESRVSRLKTVRDAAAARLELDPGVLCSRERLESIARLKPDSMEAFGEVAGLRRWQIGEMGAEFVRVLREGAASAAPAPAASAARPAAPVAPVAPAPDATPESPYRDD